MLDLLRCTEGASEPAPLISPTDHTDSMLTLADPVQLGYLPAVGTVHVADA
jgi:hypothetical protein